MKLVLVIVPCGKRKIWTKHPNMGSTAAEFAYVGAPFKVNREFAGARGDHWVILSAKYGFIEPDFSIPGNYDVSFKHSKTHPIAVQKLQQQVKEAGYDQFDRVIVLGGRQYTAMVRAAFHGTPAVIENPVEGLPIGKMMREVKRLIRIME